VSILSALNVLSSSSHPSSESDRSEALSAAELHRLTLFKWRYTLESYGFSDWEVDQLLFLTWLHATRRSRP
jgi:hypothetical protein